MVVELVEHPSDRRTRTRESIVFSGNSYTPAAIYGSITNNYGIVNNYANIESTSFFAPLNLTFLSSKENTLSQRSKRANYRAGRQVCAISFLREAL